MEIHAMKCAIFYIFFVSFKIISAKQNLQIKLTVEENTDYKNYYFLNEVFEKQVNENSFIESLKIDLNFR